MDFFSLKGKAAIITGVKQGSRHGLCSCLRPGGADLFIPYHGGSTEDIKRLVEAEGRRVVFYQGDLQDRSYLY
jgi:2-deoxy-D-gluconate 3-dehydrogenase